MQARYILMIYFALSAVTLWTQTVTWTGLGDGLNWSDPNNWSGAMIPGLTDDVLIEEDTVLVSGIQALAASLCLKNVRLGIFDSLLISNTDTFGIKAQNSILANFGIIQVTANGEQFAEEHALDLDSSSLINMGGYRVLQSMGRGINGQAGSLIENHGTMSISNTEGRGILSHGRIENHDSLIIENTTFSGIYVYDTLVNSDTAYISIANITGLGSHGILVVFEPAVLFNGGRIDLYNIEAAGLYNAASTINQGTITMDSVGTGLVNTDYFRNTPNAEINVHNVFTDEGMINGFNVFQKTTFENLGQIHLDRIVGTGLINRGCLNIAVGAFLTGGNLEGDLFINEEGAVLQVEGQIDLMVVN